MSSMTIRFHLAERRQEFPARHQGSRYGLAQEIDRPVIFVDVDAGRNFIQKVFVAS